MKRLERQWLDLIASLGCVVCRSQGRFSEAQIHHLRTGQGMGQRAPHFLVIPLCPEHHQSGGPGVAYHASPRQFEALYGSELDLLAETIHQVVEQL